jgi:hypothetical protein
MDRLAQLTQTAHEAREAAEALLGYPLKPEHFATGSAYTLLPVGFVANCTFEATVQCYQREMARMQDIVDRCKGELDALKASNFNSRGCVTPAQASEQLQRSIQSGEMQLGETRSRLLGYVLAQRPMRDADFAARLASHLDAMLDAYLAMRALEAPAHCIADSARS